MDNVTDDTDYYTFMAVLAPTAPRFFARLGCVVTESE
jgi:hypothetical protein